MTHINSNLMIDSLKSISPICLKCKGKYWVPGNQKKTQEQVLKHFGIIANNCVNNSQGTIVRCPYA